MKKNAAMADITKQINLGNVLQMLNTVDDISDQESNEDDEPTLRDRLRGNASNTTANTTATIVHETIEKAKGILTTWITDPDTLEKEKKTTMTTVINSIVKTLSRVMDSVAKQGKEMKKIVDDFASEKTQKDKLLGEIQKKYNALEARTTHNNEELTIKTDQLKEELDAKFDQAKTEVADLIKEQTADLVKEQTADLIKEQSAALIKEQSDKHAKEIKNKIDYLENQCDEARQREMKGTLIVSSPGRGKRTEAIIKTVSWDDNNTWGPEAELDMVLRMVYEKTGVGIPHRDVAACHRVGKWENHSFVLKIWNRKPFSAWEMLTEAMLTGKHFSRQNIFINFMLTPKRTEISKQVRKAKIDQQIQKYSVDQNGKIFVKKIGEDKVWHPIVSLEEIEKFAKKD